jgi:glycosyltransferase involved in cell wall biosynthesis
VRTAPPTDVGPLGMSAVVCTYTPARWDALVGCIESVERQTVPVRELIVVVDHDPELLERVTRTWPHVIAIPNDGPRGISEARNSGVRRARAAVVGFLDDDAVAAPDWVERMVAALADRRVLGAGGTVAPRWAFRRPGWFPEEFDWVVGCSYRGMPTEPAPVRNFIGASMAFRREILLGAGDFRLGQIGDGLLKCEDTEMCIRIASAQPEGHLLFDPGIRVEHRVPPPRATLRYFAARCYHEGRQKAMLARLVGGERALATERHYVSRTLPAGVVRSLRAGQLDGLLRAGAILLGLALAAAGYLHSHMARAQRA